MATEARVVACALDGSSADGGATEVATQLAMLARARLALVAIVPVPLDDAHETVLPGWTLEEALQALEQAAAALDGRIGVDCHLDVGNPVRRLIEFAERTRPLLLVVGAGAPSSGRPPSIVAGGLTRGAPCPIVVVPEAATLPELDDARRR